MDDFDNTIKGLDSESLKELLEAKQKELEADALKQSGNITDRIKGQIAQLQAKIKENDVVRKERANAAAKDRMRA